MLKRGAFTLVAAFAAASLAATQPAPAASSPQPLWVTGAFGTGLMTVNTTTGGMTRIGDTGYNGAVVLAFHPDGRLFTFTESGSTDPKVPEQLAIFNPVTGQATFIGSPLPERTQMMPAAVGPDGTLYAAGIAGSLKSKLLVVDKTTGQPVEVGPFGVDRIMDFAFDRDGTLFAGAASGLYRIDTTTGHATLITPFAGDLVGNEGSKGVMGIHFGSDGTLYATDFVVGGLGSSLFRVDRNTGVASRVAYLGMAMSHSADMVPPSPGDRANRLIASAESAGVPVAVRAKLQVLPGLIASGHIDGACAVLAAFKTDTRAVSGQGLTTSDAAQLQIDTLWAETSLDCSPLRSEIIAIVGSTRGAAGRAFSTAATISNPGETEISGRLLFHPAGVSASDADPAIAYRLKAHETRTFSDLMGSFGASGIGSAEIIAEKGAAPASAFSVEDGENSVAVPVAGLANVLAAGSRAVLTAPSDPARFRMNVGFRTLDSGVVFTARLYDATGSLIRSTALSLPPNDSALLSASALMQGNVEPGQSIVLLIRSGSMLAYTSKAANSGVGSTLELLRSIGQ